MRCEFGHGQLVAIRPVGQVAGWQIDRLSHRCFLGVYRKNDIIIFEHRGPLLDKWRFQRDMAIAIVVYTDAVCAKGSETDVVFLVLVGLSGAGRASALRCRGGCPIFLPMESAIPLSLAHKR